MEKDPKKTLKSSGVFKDKCITRLEKTKKKKQTNKKAPLK